MVEGSGHLKSQPRTGHTREPDPTRKEGRHKGVGGDGGFHLEVTRRKC